MKELWRSIKGFPDYKVSNCGRIVSYKKKSPRFIGSRAVLGKYRTVTLFNRWKVRSLGVHVLVLEVFGLPKPRVGAESLCGRHVDGNPQNNHIDNLMWGTVAQNKRDDIKMMIPIPTYKDIETIRIYMNTPKKRDVVRYLVEKEIKKLKIQGRL